jgi:hypothetical protein
MMKIYWNQYIDFPFAPLLPDAASWMIFAEKAFARTNGYYYRLEGGRFGEAIRTISGAPSREYSTCNYNAGLIFQILMTSVSKNHIISATSQRGNTAQNDEYGLVVGNHYTIIGSYEVLINGERI